MQSINLDLLSPWEKMILLDLILGHNKKKESFVPE
jgi:hypothetical protein